jgi:hypothetical protein
MKKILMIMCAAFAAQLCAAQNNPFVRHMYTADPSAHVWADGRLYVYASHDIAPPRGCDLMDQYHVFSTTDMVDWKDHGEILRASDVPWGRPEGGFMWAPDCAFKNGKYYFYFPHPSGTEWNKTWKVGIAVSDQSADGFKAGGYLDLGDDNFAMIDPCVFVDDDGQAYFYYGGGGRCAGAPLKENMIELAEPLKFMEGLQDFHEATWVFKRNGVYYLTYSDNHRVGRRGANRLHYATSNSPLGPWTHRGIYLEPTDCDTSHGSVVEYKGEWYAFYHNCTISGQGNLRSICFDKLFFNPDGTIQKVVQTLDGEILKKKIEKRRPKKAESKTYDSYNGLVMAGYQGWFSAPGDGSDRGWYHYAGQGGKFEPGICTIDMWPDVSEYEKVYKTDFAFADGSPAFVMSEYDRSTIDTHFRWMREYGVDGVFVQRFVSEIKRPKSYNQLNRVWDCAIDAADRNGRAISVMYDLSGMRPGDESVLLADIDALTAKYDLKTREKHSSYLFHNGKPLVAVWGVGFNDKRQYGFKEAETIIDALIERGFSVMIGVPTHWRDLEADTIPDGELHRIIRKCDIVMPWLVGRYNEDTFARYEKEVVRDMEWCRKNGVEYAPLAFPGFTWKNMHPDSKPIPRNNGSFFWKQLSHYIKNDATMIYVAMFDEIDEGTAIFKCATEVPVGDSYFLALDPTLGSDYYLRLTGIAAKMLKKEIPFAEQKPGPDNMYIVK